MLLRQIFADIACNLIALVRTRLELLTLETVNEKKRLFRLIGLAFLSLIFLTIGLLVVSIGVLMHYWSTPYYYTAMTTLAGFYILIGLGLSSYVRHRFANDPAPFSITLAELNRDVHAFDRSYQPTKESSHEVSNKKVEVNHV